jgi:hypothetical protein
MKNSVKSPAALATVMLLDSGAARIIFNEPQFGITSWPSCRLVQRRRASLFIDQLAPSGFNYPGHQAKSDEGDETYVG